jgi:hypothetical protein
MTRRWRWLYVDYGQSVRVVGFGLKVSRVGIGTGGWRLIGDGGPIMDVNVNLVLGTVT